MSLISDMQVGQAFLTVVDGYSRQRRKTVVDPYDPTNVTIGDWSDPDILPVSGYVHTVTSSEQADDASRSEVISTAEFVTDDTHADIKRGDRIVSGDGRKWTVQGFPARDRNPFTGWQPTLVAALQEVVG
ncbi:MAG: hypothetical protein SOI13_04360 [Bifidobacterium mongoliense]|jgi:hypothetical protein|uniref:hypothetical protein n=1 Tax=Bifidobacterium mongoliense TaxID=518643 RepID=UPI002F35EE75